jgi:cyclic pyranopterin monophosphate synthase
MRTKPTTCRGTPGDGAVELTHVSAGAARMVHVGNKPLTERFASAEAWVAVGPAIAAQLGRRGGLAKGAVVETARIAGIQAAKRTAELIPMCHVLALDGVEIDVSLAGPRVHIVSRVAARDRTGVEMEALTAAAVAALTVYDMVKSASKGVEILAVRLLEKRGGKSGTWRRGGSHG